jgi:transposase
MVVAESVRPGFRIQDVARRYGICPSLIYRWRRLARIETADSPAVQLFPVQITAAAGGPTAASRSPPPPATTPRRAGLIEIELSGGVRVSVDDGVNVAALRRVISVLRG